MHATGKAAFEARNASTGRRYSYETRQRRLSELIVRSARGKPIKLLER
jgi:hypothetical protein